MNPTFPVTSIHDIGGWEHLCIPAEWDGIRRTTSLGEYDPRTEEGELLWPEQRLGSRNSTISKRRSALTARLGNFNKTRRPLVAAY